MSEIDNHRRFAEHRALTEDWQKARFGSPIFTARLDDKPSIPERLGVFRDETIRLNRRLERVEEVIEDVALTAFYNLKRIEGNVLLKEEVGDASYLMMIEKEREVLHIARRIWTTLRPDIILDDILEKSWRKHVEVCKMQEMTP